MSFKYSKEKASNTIKKIKIEDAVGSLLAHDLTEIHPDGFKGAAFTAGHRISEDDLCHLRRLGKRHLFIVDPDYRRVHENDAAIKLADALLGCGMDFKPFPKEGKIQFKASRFGLFKVNSQLLVDLNTIPEIMCTSIYNNTTVTEGTILAAVRIIPLFIDSNLLNRVVELINSDESIFQVKSFYSMRTRLLVTGSEIHDGLVEDGFEILVKNKLESYGALLLETRILPDDKKQIIRVIKNYLSVETDLIVSTGGMSVDPDDITRYAIKEAGATRVYYGAAVTPGAMFQLAYFGEIPVISIPACALCHKVTVFDLVLPRLLAAEKLNADDLARFAHGGMCMNCDNCVYPLCYFGKN